MKIFLHTYTHGHILYSGHVLETTKTEAWAWSGGLCAIQNRPSCQKRWNPAFCYNLESPGGGEAKWSKSGERQIPDELAPCELQTHNVLFFHSDLRTELIPSWATETIFPGCWKNTGALVSGCGMVNNVLSNQINMDILRDNFIPLYQINWKERNGPFYTKAGCDVIS